MEEKCRNISSNENSEVSCSETNLDDDYTSDSDDDSAESETENDHQDSDSEAPPKKRKRNWSFFYCLYIQSSVNNILTKLYT